MADTIYATMHIFAHKSADEVMKDPKLKPLAEAALKALMTPVSHGADLAKKLGLPTPVPIKWSVEIVTGRADVPGKAPDRIPVMVSVAGIPGIMEKLRKDVVAEVTNELFKGVRNAHSTLELAQALGYQTDKPLKYHLYLPHQIRTRGPAKPGGAQGDGDGDGDGSGDSGDSGDGVVVGWIEGGWSKGCSSWPW